MEYCKHKYKFFNLDFDYLLYAHTLQILVFPISERKSSVEESESIEHSIKILHHGTPSKLF